MCSWVKSKKNIRKEVVSFLVLLSYRLYLEFFTESFLIIQSPSRTKLSFILTVLWDSLISCSSLEPPKPSNVTHPCLLPLFLSFPNHMFHLPTQSILFFLPHLHLISRLDYAKWCQRYFHPMFFDLTLVGGESSLLLYVSVAKNTTLLKLLPVVCFFLEL